MAKIIKACIKCNNPYLTNYHSERSKFCSKKCMFAYKKEQRTLKEREIRKEKSLKNAKAYEIKRKRLEREKLLNRNKNKKLIKIEDGIHKFGNDILTLKNYKEPLLEIPKGEGFGYYGTLAANVENGKIQCHICGNLYDHVGAHVFHAHNITVKDYREKFGLAYTTALVSESHRLHLKERTLEWLKSMGEEQKQAYLKRLREKSSKRGVDPNRVQPKKTMEAMNKDGSCPDQTLEAIRKVKDEIGYVPSKTEFIELKGQRYVHLAYKHFGSWTKALEMCGFDKEDYRERLSEGYKKTYTDEELLDYLVVYTQEYGQIPTASDWKRDLLPSYEAYIRRFGTIEKARKLAGVYDFIDEIPREFIAKSKYYRIKENQQYA